MGESRLTNLNRVHVNENSRTVGELLGDIGNRVSHDSNNSSQMLIEVTDLEIKD